MSEGKKGKCEEYNCSCENVEPAIRSYHAKLIEIQEKLTTEIDSAKGKIYEKVAEWKAKLKTIEYFPDPGDSQRPCAPCDCGELKSFLRNTLGEVKGNAVINCCGPDPLSPICRGDNSPAFTDKSTTNPCGEDEDDQKGAILFPCDNFLNPDLSQKDIALSKVKCLEEKSEDEGCPERKISLSIEADGDQTVLVPILNIEDLETLVEELSDLDVYIRTVRAIGNSADKDLGGQASTLKKEACLIALFDLICNGKIDGNDRPQNIGTDGKPIPTKRGTTAWACQNSMRTIGCPGTKFPNDVCEQYMHVLAWNHTLTYGHMGTINDDCTENQKWRPKADKPWNKENDINPDCAENERVYTKKIVFVPAGDPNTLNERLKEAAERAMQEDRDRFPKGCGGPLDKDENPHYRISPEEPARALGNNNCAPPGKMNADQIKERDRLINEINKTQNKIERLISQIAVLNETITAMGNINVADTEKTRNEILREITAKKTEQGYTSGLLNQLQQQLDQLNATVGLENGECWEITVSYCPANSTPKRSGRGPGNAGGGSPGDGGTSRTREKEYDHSNFYDLLRRIRNDFARGNPCGNPIAQQINDCFGGQPGKSPIGEANDENDSGPTLEPGGKGGGNGSPCSENDGVDIIDSSGPCLEIDSKTFATDSQRRKCMRRINNIVNGLLKSLDNALGDYPTGDTKGEKMKRILDIFKNLESVILSWKAKIASQLPIDANCKGFQMPFPNDETIQRLNKGFKVLNEAINDL